MGWWEQYDGIVIGDELADIVGVWIDKLVAELVEKYPTISKDQVLHTIAFCSGYLGQYDKNREIIDSEEKILAVMTVKQRREWNGEHGVPPDMSKRIAPDTELMNVYNPFTGDIV